MLLDVCSSSVGLCHKNSTLSEKDYNVFFRIARQTYRQLSHLVANNKGISLTTVVPQEETDTSLNVGLLKITQILTCKVKRSWPWFILTGWWSTCIIITSVWFWAQTVTCRPTCLYCYSIFPSALPASDIWCLKVNVTIWPGGQICSHLRINH